MNNWSLCSALSLCAFAAQAFAADWYAKDNLQPGHDPSMIRFEDGYALMSTNNNLQLWTSEDAYSWRDHKPTVSGVPQWAYTYAPNTENIWAPDIFYMNGEYRVYYCVSEFGKRNSAIGYTATTSIVPGSDGYGWKDHGHVFHTKEGTDKYNAIDADVVKDTEGNYWMAFGSFGLGIQLIKLDATTGYQASDDKTVYNIARRTSSASEGAEEGPSLIEHNGQYFLFTAWDKCCQQGPNIEQTTYKTAYGRADNVTGPYKDRAGYSMSSGGGTILMERYGRYVGPGGGEAFQDLNRVRFYLSAEVEHGALTRAASGDLKISYSETASNGEYLAYVNTAGSKIRLPMNIMQAGDYLLRYRYANGGDAAANHKVTVNGKSQTVTLPPTGDWGTFPEKSVVIVPATLKRGGNFIEIEPSPNGNFAELDRIDFLRVIRDTIPANGFDNGIRVRLTEDDLFAIKDGGYAIFENVVTDSIKSVEVAIEVKSLTGGKLSIRDGKKDGTVLSECELVAANEKFTTKGWTTVNCSNLKSLGGVKDFYLTASGVSGEAIVRNIVFASSSGEIVCNQAPCGPTSSSDKVIESSSSAVSPSSGSSSKTDSASSDKTAITAAPFNAHSSISLNSGVYTIHFDKPGNYEVFAFNPIGQLMARRSTNGATDAQFSNLPKGKYIFKSIKR